MSKTQQMPVSQASSYASQRNQELTSAHFQNKVYEDLPSRYFNTLKSKPKAVQAAILNLEAGVKKIWAKDANKKDIRAVSDMCLPSSNNIKLSDIRIEDSVQRQLDLDHVFHIVSNWDWAQMDPPKVYFDPVAKQYLCFDGQHTSVAHWYIITQILKLSSNETIPVTIYDYAVMSRVRKVFVNINDGSGKKKIEDIDLWRQRVLALRLDQDRTEENIWANRLQEIMERYDLFMTDEKFGDHMMPGACHRFREWKEYSLQVADTFARYQMLNKINTLRACESNEQDILFELFHQVAKSGTSFTDNDLTELFNWMNQKFGADFTPAEGQKYAGSNFYRKCRASFDNWWKQYSASFSVTTNKPRFSTKYYIYGYVFLTASITDAVLTGKLNLSQLPADWNYRNNDGYVPLKGDLL